MATYKQAIAILKSRDAKKQLRESWKSLVETLLNTLKQDLKTVELDHNDGPGVQTAVDALLRTNAELTVYFDEAHLVQRATQHDHLLAETIVGSEAGTTYCVEVYAIESVEGRLQLHADVYIARTPTVWR